MPRTITNEDVEAIALRVAALVATKTTEPPAANERGRFLDSASVMSRFGYTNRSSFWQFVHSQGVPCVRLSGRHIVFDSLQVED